jgi:hypothetical protein
MMLISCGERVLTRSYRNINHSSSLADLAIGKVDQKKYDYDAIRLTLTPPRSLTPAYAFDIKVGEQEPKIKATVAPGTYQFDLSYLKGGAVLLSSSLCEPRSDTFTLKPRREMAVNVVTLKLCTPEHGEVKPEEYSPPPDKPQEEAEVTIEPVLPGAPKPQTAPSAPQPQGLVLSDVQKKAVTNLLNKRKESLGVSHAVAVCHIVPFSHVQQLERDDPVLKMSEQNHLKITGDGENALLTAALFAETRDETYARYSATILADWAKVNRSFTGKNGFLEAAWGVGAMARAARILKEHKSPEWQKIEGKVTRWFIDTAESQWLPRNPERPLPDTSPQLLSSWEMNNVSNRTFTSLEATLHVAYLIGDDAWFNKGIEKYKEILPKFFNDASGKHADDFRKDAWHIQAGIASAVQICKLAGRKKHDLFPLQNHAVLRSAEYYAPRITTQFIPFWEALVAHYGTQKAPQSANVLSRDKGSYYAWYIHGVEFNWGLPQFL